MIPTCVTHTHEVLSGVGSCRLWHMDIMISYLVGRWMDKRFDGKAVVLSSEGATAARGSCGRTGDKSKHDDLDPDSPLCSTRQSTV